MKRVLTWLIILPVLIWRWVISPVLPPSCRFVPSCSSYALTVLVRFGPFRGSYLTVRRILRCHPWHEGGYDPPPPHRSKEGYF